MMKPFFLPAVAVLALGAIGTPAFAQQEPTAHEPGLQETAYHELHARGNAMLSVDSPSFTLNSDIPLADTRYRGDRFPGLTWDGAPIDTKSFVVIVQDGDAMKGGEPLVHWTMYNIKPSTQTLSVGEKSPPSGAHYGPSSFGKDEPYMGPKTPAGPKHRYHWEVFALDTKLALSPSANYDALVAAMKGHVISSGETIGLGTVDPKVASGDK
ncbi:MAG: YbhB/YbcL family Raf kinase inhibitor-like protein [Gemmatimonadaceae bacterium]